MSALTDALAACIQIHDNQQALADPVAITAAAELAFKQAVVAAIENQGPIVSGDLTEDQIASLKPGALTYVPAQPDYAALEEQIAALTAKVESGEAALAAFEAALHPTTAPTVLPAGNVMNSSVGASTAAEAPAATPAVPAAEIPPTIAPTTGSAA